VFGLQAHGDVLGPRLVPQAADELSATLDLGDRQQVDRRSYGSRQATAASVWQLGWGPADARECDTFGTPGLSLIVHHDDAEREFAYDRGARQTAG
jgi:hypothetical protein